MNLQKPTAKAQNQLGEYCRTGVNKNIPGVIEKRLHHYRRLVFNVVKNTMHQAYPLTLQVLGEKKFNGMIHDFFSHHKSKTPQVWKLPGEFYEYALNTDFKEKTAKKWLNDLLLFEWIEIEVHTMPDKDIPEFNPEGNIMEDILLSNPESRMIQLEYPVHLMGVKEAEKNKGSYFVLVTRDPGTGKVNFFNLSVLHTWIYEKITYERINIKKILHQIPHVFGIQKNEKLIVNISAFLTDLLERKAFIGFAK